MAKNNFTSLTSLLTSETVISNPEGAVDMHDVSRVADNSEVRSWGDDEAARRSLRRLVDSGWRDLWSEIFGEQLVDVMAPHHEEGCLWHYDARMELLNGGQPINDWWSYFPIWPRGHMKSTIARRMSVIDAMMSWSYDVPSYILYISRVYDMAKRHAMSIETLIRSPEVKHFCPMLSQVKRNEMGQAKGWQATFLNTLANTIYHCGGLDEGLAGANIDDIRPTFIFLDDIDGRERSPQKTKTRFTKLTEEILPMRQENTLAFWPQNLINDQTTMYRVQHGHERILTNRKPTVPIPAFRNFKTEVQTIEGIVKDVIVSGEPTWEYYSIERGQQEINTYGLQAFLQECQHEVEGTNEGVLLHNYDDEIHVISESQFASRYGSKYAWKRWRKWFVNDWARTKTARHANVGIIICSSPQSEQLSGFTFYIPISFPASTEPEDVAERFLTELTPIAYKQRDDEPGITWSELRRDNLIRLNAAQHYSSKREQIQYEREYLASVFPQYVAPVLRKYRVEGAVNSHTEDTVRQVFNDVYGMDFVPSNPGHLSEVDTINALFRVDKNEPHPFKYNVNGFTRTFIIAPDDATDTNPKVINNIVVRRPTPYIPAIKPDELQDSDLMRYQLKKWRLAEPKLTESGERIDQPLKENDDFPDCLKMFHFLKLQDNEPQTLREKIDLLIPDEVKIHLEELSAENPLTFEKQQLFEYYRDQALRDLLGDENADMLSEFE